MRAGAAGREDRSEKIFLTWSRASFLKAGLLRTSAPTFTSFSSFGFPSLSAAPFLGASLPAFLPSSSPYLDRPYRTSATSHFRICERRRHCTHLCVASKAPRTQVNRFAAALSEKKGFRHQATQGLTASLLRYGKATQAGEWAWAHLVGIMWLWLMTLTNGLIVVRFLMIFSLMPLFTFRG